LCREFTTASIEIFISLLLVHFGEAFAGETLRLHDKRDILGGRAAVHLIIVSRAAFAAALRAKASL
jgi:hypothetical protein